MLIQQQVIFSLTSITGWPVEWQPDFRIPLLDSDLPKQELAEYRMFCRNKSQPNRIFCRIPNSWQKSFYQVKNGLEYRTQAKSFKKCDKMHMRHFKRLLIKVEGQIEQMWRKNIGKALQNLKKMDQKLAETQKVSAGQLAENFRPNVRPNINLTIRQKLVSVDH